MQSKSIVSIFVIAICFIACSSMHQTLSDEQKYGQKPPGITPELYEPDFKFLENQNPICFAFSPRGDEICFNVEDTTFKERYERYVIYYVQRTNGDWTTPEPAYFIPNQGKGALPQFSSDGQSLIRLKAIYG